MIEALAWIVAGLALLPLAMSIVNAACYRKLPSPPATDDALPPVSVLIPARNEEANIGQAVDSILANEGVTYEVIVLDDQSTDATAGIVQARADTDPRVRLLSGSGPPEGWNGKQYACWQLARESRYDLLLWLDADVRLTQTALTRIVHPMAARPCDLLSGFPLQIARTWAEKLVVSLIPFVLLGYLPMPIMRWSRDPGFGAGCGQLFLARRQAYEQCGGHSAIRNSLHDGVKLPRAFRLAGFTTDLFDATDLASCRMYGGLKEVWSGFAKNATEGMATPIALPVWTVLLLGGHVAPWLLLVAGAWVAMPAAAMGCAAGVAAAQSLLIGLWQRQPFAAIVGRPVGVMMLLAIQWQALAGKWRGQPTSWKGRSQQVG